MGYRKNYGALDYFRLVAAFMIVAIHTSPLKSFNEVADFLVTYCMGRVAVPFFLMVTGFFVLAPYQKSLRRPLHVREHAASKVKKFLKKTTMLYGVAILLYLPVMVYAKQWGNSLGEWLKDIFFDGTFYHLWYLPAALMGCLLLVGMMRLCSPLAISCSVSLLYVVGTVGDSYYLLASQAPAIKAVYEGIFVVSSYTRNGVFFAPVFLWMGVLAANGKLELPARKAAVGFGVSMAGMLAEGMLTWAMGWQKHNSMYFLLLPVMFFLFEWLLAAEADAPAILRDVSMCIYIVHPICIILVRGAAGALKLEKLLVGQSLVHYLAVCMASAAISFAMAEGMQLWKNRAWR